MRVLPMFPLGTPLVPHTGIPLHVFEPRYRALTRDVLAADRRFGIVMIERGSEVGGGDVRADVGVIVEVADETELDDGRWLLLVVGVGRIAVVDWLPEHPYPRAVIDEIEEVDASLGPEVAADLQRRTRRIAALLTELGEPAPPITVELADDPVIAAWQAVAVGPLGPLDTQRILEIDDPDVRVGEVVAALDEAEQVLLLRMSG